MPFTCPRRSESPFVSYDTKPGVEEDKDEWRAGNTCSYCGSMHQADFFAAIEEGAELSPTDKSYKVYVGSNRKFYFQHLDQEGRTRFIELYNDGKMKLRFPGYFYVHPFFCKPRSEVTA
jgi:hypothetical protein